MIDKSKKLMAMIVDPVGQVECLYFDDYPDYVHFQALRNYIKNKSISFSLKYDLDLTDKSQSDGKNIETRLDKLVKIFIKNGYMLLVDSTDYRNAYQNGENHSGWISLPTEIGNLPDEQKFVLEELSNEIMIERTTENTNQNPNKIPFFTLPVNYYDKYKKDITPEIGQFDEIITQIREETKHR